MTAYFTHAKPFDDEHYFMHTYEINVNYDVIKNVSRIVITNMDTKKYALMYIQTTDVEKDELFDMAKTIIMSRGFTI